MSVLSHIQNLKHQGKKGIALLIDPDETRAADLPRLFEKIAGSKVELLLVGGSLLLEDHFNELIPALRTYTDLPIVLFPGNVLQIHPEADALLLLSLISGRNPEMLIGNHVIAAPRIKRSGLETVPTGYLLVECGRQTSVNYMSNTRPIPWDKPDIAACTALAGEQLGLKLIYMDGGSGSERTISPEMISAVSKMTDLPLIIGGGIRSARQADEIFRAGADLIVLGTAMEREGGEELLREISELIPVYSV